MHYTVVLHWAFGFIHSVRVYRPVLTSSLGPFLKGGGVENEAIAYNRCYIPPLQVIILC